MNDPPGKVLSSLTAGNGSDKQLPKVGGCVGVFFQLFDWNRSVNGKKLFSNRLLPAERPKLVQRKCADEKLPMAKLLLIADENRGGFPSARRSSSDNISSTEESSRSLSEDGHPTRAPGVVARLMGLESLPSSQSIDHHGKDCNEKASETRPLPEILHQRRQFDHLNKEHIDPFDTEKRHAKLNSLVRKSAESRPQKLQKTGLFEKRPVTKFQPEALAFKSILSPSKSNAKMMSPVKSPGILSAKNAARLMDAAAKILEPGMQTSNKARNPLIRGSISRPLLKDQREGDEKRGNTKRHGRVPELVRKSATDSSNNAKSFKCQSLGRNWNGKESPVFSKENINIDLSSAPSAVSSARENCANTGGQEVVKRKVKHAGLQGKQDVGRAQSKSISSKSTTMKKERKTLSLALEAKANVQKREFEQSLLNSTQDMASTSNSIKGLERHIDQVKDRSDVPREQDQLLEPRKSVVQQAVSGNVSLKQSFPAIANKSFSQVVVREKVQNKSSRPHTKGNKTFPGDTSSRPSEKQGEHVSEPTIPSRSMYRNRCSPTTRNSANRYKDKEGSRKLPEEKKFDSSCYSAKASPKKKRTSDGHLTGESASFGCYGMEEGYNGSFEREIKATSVSSTDLLSRDKGHDSIQSFSYGDTCHKVTQQDSLVCSKSSIDVVSFTFSSPLRCAAGASQTGTSSEASVCKSRDLSTAGINSQSVTPEFSNSNSFSSVASSVFGGDSLNALLEQKLKELTSTGRVDMGVGHSSRDMASSKTTASILQDLILTLNTERPAGSGSLNTDAQESLCSNCTTVEFTRPLGNPKVFQVEREYEEGFSCQRPGLFSSTSRSRGFENSESVSDMACAEECDQPSPVSILEASFSNDSCNSAENLGVIHDVSPQLPLRPSIQNSSGELSAAPYLHQLDSELCDSASSANLEVVETDKIMDAILDISRLHKIDPSSIGFVEADPFVDDDDRGLDYIRHIVSNSEYMSDDVGLLSDEDIPDFLVDPNLFDMLELQTADSSHSKNDGKSLTFRKARRSWQKRSLFFDCVKESLCSRYSTSFKGNYSSWIKRVAALASTEKLARDILLEINNWRLMCHRMLDEVVEKDMSTPAGKWTDFEREMFEIGAEVEKMIYSCLVEEIPDVANDGCRPILAFRQFAASQIAVNALHLLQATVATAASLMS